MNRLISAAGSTYGAQIFQYDAIGNMTSKAARSMEHGAGSAGPHAVTSVTAPSGQLPSFCNEFTSGLPSPVSCLFEYDANGNMTKRGVDKLYYDSENRLKEMWLYEGKTGKTKFSLYPGKNWVSFTYLPEDRSVTNVLNSLTFGTHYNRVSTFDEKTQNWIHFVNDPAQNGFSTIEYGRSYEISFIGTAAKAVSISGVSPATNVRFDAKVGDNTIGPAVKSAVSVGTVLKHWMPGTDFSDVLRFNAQTQTYESFKTGKFSAFDPGRGYLLKSLKNKSFSYGQTRTVTKFVVDSTGARVKKIVGARPPAVYFGKDYEIEGGLTSKHIFLGDRRISTKKSDGMLEYIHSDHINSSNVITDASGNQAALLEYDPYGSTVTHTGTVNPSHKYAGKEEDSSTRLYDYGARYYDPELGRFITADPTVQNPEDPQDLNRYAYARNDPVRFNDPTYSYLACHIDTV